MLARENIADEHRPWATIISNAPVIPHEDMDRAPASIRAICPTDEYAISDFKSGCRKQIILVRMAPIMEIVKIRGL